MRYSMLILPADSGGGGDGQILHLKQHVDVRRKLDSLGVGQAQHLVVVQHGVHVLNPQGVHRAITDHPLVVCRRVLKNYSHCEFANLCPEKLLTL